MHKKFAGWEIAFPLNTDTIGMSQIVLFIQTERRLMAVMLEQMHADFNYLQHRFLDDYGDVDYI